MFQISLAIHRIVVGVVGWFADRSGTVAAVITSVLTWVIAVAFCLALWVLIASLFVSALPKVEA